MNKNILTLILLITIIMTPLHTARAGAWGEVFAAMLEKQILEQIWERIKEALETAAKDAAIITVTQTTQRLLTGYGGESLVISDPTDYIFRDPARQVNGYINDFFTLTTRGRGSRGNYHSFSVGNRNGLTYEGELVQHGRIAVGLEGNQNNYVNIQEYCPSTNVRDVFGDGDFRCFNALFSNPLNNPYGFSLIAQSEAQRKYQEAVTIAQAEFEAGRGIAPVRDEFGNTITPGSIVAEIQIGALTLPLNALANADTAESTAILSAAVVSAMNQIVQQGVGLTRERLQREINDQVDSFRTGVFDKTEEFGPGVQFQLNEIYDGIPPAGSGSGGDDGSGTIGPPGP